MPGFPDTRRYVVLTGLYVRYGFCTSLRDEDLSRAASATEVVDLIIETEGLDPQMSDTQMRREMIAIADDWLFAPRGCGAASGKPW
ncbi:hypothetical protein [Solirubrobacter soli]|uniref:hypothetical protein n=1 Tax=Solirubrobacter soli TaxID=363832 RepID=UPI0012FCB22D|nr:hypothetical protein [Solirubrobacter soli]